MSRVIKGLREIIDFYPDNNDHGKVGVACKLVYESLDLPTSPIYFIGGGDTQEEAEKDLCLHLLNIWEDANTNKDYLGQLNLKNKLNYFVSKAMNIGIN